MFKLDRMQFFILPVPHLLLFFSFIYTLAFYFPLPKYVAVPPIVDTEELRDPVTDEKLPAFCETFGLPATEYPKPGEAYYQNLSSQPK